MLGVGSPRLSEILVASGMKPGAKLSDIYEVCSEALKRDVRKVCIPTAYLREASVFTKDTGLKISTVISFSTGLLPVELKIMEMRLAFEQGVEEACFYPNVGNYLDSRILEFEWELSRILEASQLIGLNHVTPVLDAGLLTGKQVGEVVNILEASGFDTLAISTGFGLKNMGDDELKLLKTIGESIYVEAHCRVGSLQDVQKLIDNRVSRVCTVDYRLVLEEGFKQKV
jgi:deoxyribose-phosphate aldolase